jgi:hypothetical protein
LGTAGIVGGAALGGGAALHGLSQGKRYLAARPAAKQHWGYAGPLVSSINRWGQSGVSY